MSQILERVKKGIAFYRKHDFRAFIKTVKWYLLNEFQLKRYCYFLSLKTKTIDQRRIFYIDHFSFENSNLYWLKAFQKVGKVKTFDIIKEDHKLLKKRIMNFKPVHIHLGGSVKDNMVLPQLLFNVKSQLRCTISVFYGDALYSPYHCELARIVDCIYVSNKTHIRINEQKGLTNFEYMPCPTDDDIFYHQKCKKVYDVIFIGNNNQSTRLALLKRLANNFNLMVFGNGWEGTGLNYGKSVYGKKFTKVCNKAKICLGVIDSKWTELEAYFSNRLVNTLATRSFCIQRYTKGLEKIFTNQKHLVWYTTESELIKLIEYYLLNEKEREEIAAQGQQKVYENYTYKKSVKRIIEDANLKRTLKLNLGSGSSYLKGYVNIDKYNPVADRVMDVCKLDYPDNSVDEIFTSHMVEHLTYYEFIDALKEWRRVLKENGTLIIRCPNFERHLRDWLNASYEKRFGKNNRGVNVILGFQDRGPGYINRNIFTVRRLRELVNQAGFEILECHTHPTRDGSVSDGDILLKAVKVKLNELDEKWQGVLTIEKRRKGRFSLKWYQGHPITKELLNSDVLEGKVIDLGCGIGARSFLAAKENHKIEVTATDASQYAIRYAIENFKLPNLSFLCADLLKLPYQDHDFDNAYMIAVIEHIANTNALFAEIKRVVKPKGRLFLSVTEKDYHSDPNHVHIFTKKSLKSIITQNKLKVLDLYVREKIIFCIVEI